MLNLATLNACAWPTLGRVNAAAISRAGDRKSTRLNSSHDQISYAVFCLKKKKKKKDKGTCDVSSLVRGWDGIGSTAVSYWCQLIDVIDTKRHRDWTTLQCNVEDALQCQ